MGLLDYIADDIAYAFEDVGESITYTPANSSIEAFACNAIFSEMETGMVEDNAVEDRNACLIQQSDLTSSGVTTPAKAVGSTLGDSITQTGIDGSSIIWSVIEATPLRIAAWRLTLAKDLRFFRS